MDKIQAFLIIAGRKDLAQDYFQKLAEMTKRFEHDCDDCVFLGQYGHYDLYAHSGDRESSIIYRYGDEGDYGSGLNITTNPTKEGFIRAVKMGFKWNPKSLQMALSTHRIADKILEKILDGHKLLTTDGSKLILENRNAGHVQSLFDEWENLINKIKIDDFMSSADFDKIDQLMLGFGNDKLDRYAKHKILATIYECIGSRKVDDFAFSLLSFGPVDEDYQVADHYRKPINRYFDLVVTQVSFGTSSSSFILEPNNRFMNFIKERDGETLFVPQGFVEELI